VHGVGFLTKAAKEEDYSVSKYSFQPLSENDLHTQFAEAVIAGVPGSNMNFEVTTGVPYRDPAVKDQLPYLEDPRFAIFKQPGQSRASRKGGVSGPSAQIKDRLQEAQTLEAVQDAIQGDYLVYVLVDHLFTH
jgi:hypothetical protein